MSSDAPTPQKQAEQIMAIYPILRGQKVNGPNVIPPRGSLTGANAQRSTQADQQGDDLINFGQNDDPAPPVSNPAGSSAGPGAEPKIDPHHRSTAEIQSMLSATGTPTAPGEPLIDFHQDLEKDLPRADLKRGDTGESHDEFVDALE
jgi:hypothetical protein